MKQTALAILFFATFFLAPWQVTTRTYGGHISGTRTVMGMVWKQPTVDTGESAKLMFPTIAMEWCGIVVLYVLIMRKSITPQIKPA